MNVPAFYHVNNLTAKFMVFVSLVTVKDRISEVVDWGLPKFPAMDHITFENGDSAMQVIIFI